MVLKEIELTNFRNYKSQKLEFINGINLFVGDNAQGKTNIIESIYLSAFGKSYRTVKDMEIIKFHEDFCRINSKFVNSSDSIEQNIEIFIDKNNKKSIKRNDVKISRLSDHVGNILIVIFSPDSLDIVKGAPAKRREFLDMICCQLSKSYLIMHQEYMKCLKLKNSMLKKEIVDKDYLLILNQKMSEYIEKIVKFRDQVIEKLLKKAKGIQRAITEEKEDIELEYVTDFKNLSSNEINRILDRYLEIELMKKSSLKGIQRDDIKIKINNLEVDKFGSQGQSRTALLTLKLANFEVLIDEKDDIPILLLDDIMSELDGHRISFLLKYIEKYQSIITTTDSSFVENVDNIKISKVLNGRLEI